MKKFIQLKFKKKSVDEMLARSQEFLTSIKKRRSVREFSSQDVPQDIIVNCINAANYAPSGANKQPWHFVIVKDPDVKKKIRVEAEKEEKVFYENRATEEWLKDLEQFETNASKPFLEEAPYLIAIFEEKYSVDKEGKKHKNYYVKESVGIATGFLIAALHLSGLATLTHTPSPMNFLNKILQRPQNEKPFLLLVIGYPKEGTKVPDIKKKKLEKIVSAF